MPVSALKIWVAGQLPKSIWRKAPRCVGAFLDSQPFPLCTQKQQQEALVPTEEESSCPPGPLILAMPVARNRVG